jgi:hypothetical protein
MRSKIYSFTLLLLIAAAGQVRAQNSLISGLMQTSLSKIKMSSQAGRVIERTFTDIFFKDDSTGNNCLFFHKFSSNNTYRINAFASSGDVSNINVGVYLRDSNNKWTKVVASTTTGYDVSIQFSPQSSGFYFLFLKGTLRTNINSALFDVIIERE